VGPLIAFKVGATSFEGAHVNKHASTNERDFYEIRPFLIIAVGLLGCCNSFLVPATPVLSTLGVVCGIVLLFSAAKIIRWRKDFRNKWV
jgi:hypothetical protein